MNLVFALLTLFAVVIGGLIVRMCKLEGRIHELLDKVEKL